MSAFSRALNITNMSFDEIVKSDTIVVIMFYAPWCGHSKSLLPVWEDLESLFSPDHAKALVVAKVDCVDQPDLYWKENITSFPTIKVFFRGLAIKYEGEKDKGSLLQYFEYISSQLINIKNLESWHSFHSKNQRDSSSRSIFSLHTHLRPEPELSLHFEYICKMYRITCAVTNNELLSEDLSLQLPAVVASRNFPGEKNSISLEGAALSIETMYQFVEDKMYPLVTYFNPDNHFFLFSSTRQGFQNHVIFAVDMKTTVGQSWFEVEINLAGKFKNRCLFIVVDVSDSSSFSNNILSDLELKRESTPSFLIVSSHQTEVRFYKFGGSIDAKTCDESSIENWIDTFFSGNLSPIRKIESS